MRKFISLCLMVFSVCFLALKVFAGVEAWVGFMPITPANAHLLELGYIIPSVGCDLSPDGRFAQTSTDIYDLVRGESVFADKNGFRIQPFSPDETMMVATDGVHETRYWRLIFPIPHGAYPPDVEFSYDSSLLAVSGLGVFDTATWQKKFDIPTLSEITFSSDGQWLRAGADIYNPQTGEIVYSFPYGTWFTSFSPDGTMIADGDRIYETATWQELYYVSDPAYFSPNSRYAVTKFRGVIDTRTGQPAPATTWGGVSEDFDFRPDSRLIAFGEHEWTVQDLDTGAILFYFDGNSPRFSRDGLLLATAGGVYDVNDGSRLYQFPFETHLPAGRVRFGFNNRMLALKPPNYSGAQFCALYGIPGGPWPYRSGMVRIGPNGFYPVYATTSDRKWLRTGEDTWIALSDAEEIISLPRGIPVETRSSGPEGNISPPG